MKEVWGGAPVHERSDVRTVAIWSWMHGREGRSNALTSLPYATSMAFCEEDAVEGTQASSPQLKKLPFQPDALVRLPEARGFAESG